MLGRRLVTQVDRLSKSNLVCYLVRRAERADRSAHRTAGTLYEADPRRRRSACRATTPRASSSTFYLEDGVLERNPFEVLDRDGVGDLMRIGVERGRKTKPDIKLGICGEHGGEPSLGRVLRHEIGLDYGSRSPEDIRWRASSGASSAQGSEARPVRPSGRVVTFAAAGAHNTYMKRCSTVVLLHSCGHRARRRCGVAVLPRAPVVHSGLWWPRRRFPAHSSHPFLPATGTPLSSRALRDRIPQIVSINGRVSHPVGNPTAHLWTVNGAYPAWVFTADGSNTLNQ